MPNCAGIPPTDEEIAAAIKTNAEQRARVAAMSTPVYAAFFMGQGGYLFSSGFAGIANTASARGIITTIQDYTEVDYVRNEVPLYRSRGCKIALIGYSLGCTTATYLQTLMPVDLVICIAESTIGDNHIINRTNTKRSVLYYGTDFLSSAGRHDGFDETIPVGAGWGIPVLSHLLVPSTQTVVNGVLGELAKLKGN